MEGEGDINMIRTEFSERVSELLSKDKIGNLNIFGIIENEPEVDIYVDDVNSPNGALVRNGYFNYIYCREEEFVLKVKEKFLNKGYFGFSGVNKDIANIIKKGYKIEWENPCYLLYLPPEKLSEKMVKNEVQNIRLDDAHIIDKFYTYRHEGSLDMIKEYIKTRPSSAIYKDGEIVSWVLVHNDNSMGIMYTKEEYRKLGYAYDLTIDLSKKLVQLGKIPFVHIVKNNTPSINLAKKCGFEIYDEVSWFGIIAE